MLGWLAFTTIYKNAILLWNQRLEKKVGLIQSGVDQKAYQRGFERSAFGRNGSPGPQVAAGIVADEIPEHAMPDIARVLKNRIGFLRTRPELAKAF